MFLGKYEGKLLLSMEGVLVTQLSSNVGICDQLSELRQTALSLSDKKGFIPILSVPSDFI
jgi:hypothetical protein